MKLPLSREPRYALNAVCPYFTMFPLEFPLSQLRDASKNSVLLDAFCGRGTTVYAGAIRGFETYGIDSSPVAVAIAKAKLAHTSYRQVMTLARHLVASIKWPSIPRREFWSYAYHPDTLRQLCRLRTGLLELPESPTTVLLRAIVLGSLHGPRAKDLENQSYLSNQMPRTYASKPDYSVKYWRRRHLRPPKVDVLTAIGRRAKRVFASDRRARSATCNVVLGNSEDPQSYSHVRNPVTLVVTSPPYYGLDTYNEDQWVRNWFLGGPSEVEYRRFDQISHSSQDDFAFSLARVWDNVANVGADNLRMVVRFGAIRSRKVDPIELFMMSLRKSTAEWRVLTRVSCGTARRGKRQAIQMAVESAAITEHDFHVVRV